MFTRPHVNTRGSWENSSQLIETRDAVKGLHDSNASCELMAEALANSSHGGYEDDFVEAVEEDLKCVICQFPLRDPVLTKCGHRFCNKCLDTYFTR